MGQVFRARDEVLGREVAVKRLDVLDQSPAEVGAHVADAGAALAREARAAAGLSHPNIAAVYDAGADEAGRGYVVMELVPGRTLRAILQERRTLPPVEAARLAASLADGLEAAHRRGVVHCDVKPQNVVVAPDGTPKLVDFGIARASDSTRTLSGEVRGSAPYVSPEQARGERVDGRSDVYALGAVLFELLTGRPPFQGENAAAVVAQRLVTDPPRPRSLDPSIPADLEQVVLTALARDPARRYARADDLGGALRAYLARAASEQTTRVTVLAPARPRAGAPAMPARARVRALRAALAAGLLLAGGTLLALAQGGARSTDGVAASPPAPAATAIPPAPPGPRQDGAARTIAVATARQAAPATPTPTLTPSPTPTATSARPTARPGGGRDAQADRKAEKRSRDHDKDDGDD